MPVINSSCSSSSSISMESSVNFEKKYNPEAITNYYSCGVQAGRIKNPDVKDLILKVKQHLSAIGWSFFYICKNSGRRELRYRSPVGRTYFSLRTACQALIHHNQDLEIGSSKIEELQEPETKLEEDEEFLRNNRPMKRIRIEDVENSYFHQQKEESRMNNNDWGTIVNEIFDRKRLQDLKRVLEPDKEKIEVKPKKRIRKMEASSTRRRCVLSLLIEKNIVLRGSRVVYRNKKEQILAKGRVYDDGIQCDCCGVFFLLSKFEVHARSTYHRPAANIFLDDGRSLFDCQTQLQQETKVFSGSKSRKTTHGVTCNDEFCSFCYDDGELLCCDSCTSSFHSTCIGLDGIPDSTYWFCPSCCCRICHQGQISKSTMEDSQDHGKVIKCRQCEHHFHTDCITKLGYSMSSTNSGNWICSNTCERIYSGLMAISGQSIRLTMDNMSWSLLKQDTNMNSSTEIYSKLKIALEVMHECFLPIKHPWSDKDLLKDVIFSRSNFKGFYTAVLERDDEMITVVTVRIHGCKVAEIPLIATRFRYRRLGMCRILLADLERKLGELGIERLVLPAVPEMVSTWTKSFGFSIMTETERLELVECKFLDFPGTIKCQKILRKM